MSEYATLATLKESTEEKMKSLRAELEYIIPADEPASVPTEYGTVSNRLTQTYLYKEPYASVLNDLKFKAKNAAQEVKAYEKTLQQTPHDTMTGIATERTLVINLAK